jgi:hypothetical protein
MRALFLAAAASVFALSANTANAMGAGGADLSPDQSPYAILEPITLGPAAIAPESTETLPAVPVRHSARHHRRSAQRLKPR